MLCDFFPFDWSFRQHHLSLRLDAVATSAVAISYKLQIRGRDVS